MLAAWRQLREQIVVLDKAIRAIVKQSATCRLLMSVPGIGELSVLAYVSTVEDPMRFARSRSVAAAFTPCALSPPSDRLESKPR
jgi:transposase